MPTPQAVCILSQSMMIVLQILNGKSRMLDPDYISLLHDESALIAWRSMGKEAVVECH